MTTNIATLERKATKLLYQMDEQRRPQTRVFVLEQGDELSREQRASIGPLDQVVIRYYPREWIFV